MKPIVLALSFLLLISAISAPVWAQSTPADVGQRLAALEARMARLDGVPGRLAAVEQSLRELHAKLDARPMQAFAPQPQPLADVNAHIQNYLGMAIQVKTSQMLLETISPPKPPESNGSTNWLYAVGGYLVRGVLCIHSIGVAC